RAPPPGNQPEQPRWPAVGSGEYGPAREHLQRALAMQQRLLDVFLAGASEAEGWNRLASLPLFRHALLSICLHLPNAHAVAYPALRDGRARLGRLLERRRQALQLTADPQAGHLARQLLACRQQLAHLLLTPDAKPQQQTLVQRLSRQKEEL